MYIFCSFISYLPAEWIRHAPCCGVRCSPKVTILFSKAGMQSYSIQLFHSVDNLFLCVCIEYAYSCYVIALTGDAHPTGGC